MYAHPASSLRTISAIPESTSPAKGKRSSDFTFLIFMALRQATPSLTPFSDSCFSGDILAGLAGLGEHGKAGSVEDDLDLRTAVFG